MSVQAVVDEQKEASAGLKRAELARLQEDPLPQNAEEHVAVLGYRAHVDRHRRQVAENDPKKRLAKALRNAGVAPLTTESVERYKEGVVRRSRVRANLESQSVYSVLSVFLGTPSDARERQTTSYDFEDFCFSCLYFFGLSALFTLGFLGILSIAAGVGSYAITGYSVCGVLFGRYLLRVVPPTSWLARRMNDRLANPVKAKSWTVVEIRDYDAYIPERTLDIATALKKELGDDAELCVDYVADDQTYQTVDRRALNALEVRVDDALDWAFDPFLVLNFNGDSIYVDFWDEKSYKPTYVEL